MKEALIKTIQKFLNTHFWYAALLIMLDKQKDLLLTKNVLDKTDDFEYNALWDTIIELEKMFLYANAPNWVIGAEISVLKVFNDNLKERKLKFNKDGQSN